MNPLFALLDAEFAHRLAVSAAAHGFVPREKRPDPPVLGLELWGRNFTNPIGLAAAGLIKMPRLLRVYWALDLALWKLAL